jgi:hypothetical protein
MHRGKTDINKIHHMGSFISLFPWIAIRAGWWLKGGNPTGPAFTLIYFCISGKCDIEGMYL